MKRALLRSIALPLVVGAGILAWRDWEAMEFREAADAAAAPIRAAAASAAGRFSVDVHLRGVDLSTFVLDAKGEGAAPVDLARIVFSTCTVLRRERPGAALVLARNGQERFLLPAEAVAELGDDNEKPMYRMRILPVRATAVDSAIQAFEDPQGGALYVMKAIAENMTEFGRRWLE